MGGILLVVHVQEETWEDHRGCKRPFAFFMDKATICHKTGSVFIVDVNAAPTFIDVNASSSRPSTVDLMRCQRTCCMSSVFMFFLVCLILSRAPACHTTVQFTRAKKKRHWEDHGSDEIEMDDSVRTTFTFNNRKGECLELAGVPTKHQGCLWFALVETQSLHCRDRLRAAEASVTHDGFQCGDGHREPLTRLRSGRWGLPDLWGQQEQGKVVETHDRSRLRKTNTLPLMSDVTFQPSGARASHVRASTAFDRGNVLRWVPVKWVSACSQCPRRW